ncbi:hypothetical protein C9374_002900 [Naegleria lovaniensis]|uniref:Uncharacterized protein n=1 Tax=Naegleria lovaniensis TaxID=51637 RepID=A0AA88KLW1_NAELO|nr:uncharacterized protein C9374_002900 [Naegleria lovaniensis]KAG2385751.1 hypothetical protein C9374_002900 [Naegleria lovaniensis]
MFSTPSLEYFYPTFSSPDEKVEQQDKSHSTIGSLFQDMNLRDGPPTTSSPSASSSTTELKWNPISLMPPTTTINFLSKPRNVVHGDTYLKVVGRGDTRRELSFDEWRLVASFVTKFVAFKSLANVNRTSRLAVLSCHFVQDWKCVESFVLKWMKRAKAAGHSDQCRGENSLLPNERLHDMLYLLHDLNLFDLNQFVHPMEKNIHYSHEDSLVPIPNYYSMKCVQCACELGFYALIDQLIEKPFLLPSIMKPSERNLCLKLAFSNNNDETAKRIVKLYIRRIFEDTPYNNLLQISDHSLHTILVMCADSQTSGIIVIMYSFLQQEFAKTLKDQEANDILSESINTFFIEGQYYSKLLNKKDFESALFVLQKYLALNCKNNRTSSHGNELQPTSLSVLGKSLKGALAYSRDVEFMLWLFNTLFTELTPYIENPNSIISDIAQECMLSANTKMYCEYIQKYEKRDVNKDKILVEHSLASLNSTFTVELFSLIRPSFNAFQQALLRTYDKADMLFGIFEPWLSENYPEELADFLFQRVTLLREGSDRYTDPQSSHVKKLFNSRVQKKLASLFMADKVKNWADLIYLMQTYECLSDFYEFLFEKFQTDRKLGLSKLFQFIAEHKANVIVEFPRVFPLMYNSITDMSNIYNVKLKKDFQLVTHSTQLLIFLLRHPILGKYLNLLASFWPTITSISNTKMKYFFNESAQCNPDIIAVLNASMMSEKEIAEIIQYLLSKDVAYFNSFIHINSITTDHLLQIPSTSFFNPSNLTHIRDVCKIVNLLWTKFEQDQVKIKFRDLFCVLYSSTGLYDHVTVVMKYHRKFMEMIEDIMYEMLLCDDYFDTVSQFKLRLNDSCSSQAKDMEIFGPKEFDFTPTSFLLRNPTRLIDALKSKTNKHQRTKFLVAWKSLIQQLLPSEAMDEVSKLLTLLQPINDLGGFKNQMLTNHTISSGSTMSNKAVANPFTTQPSFDFSKNPFSSGSSPFTFNTFSFTAPSSAACEPQTNAKVHASSTSSVRKNVHSRTTHWK